MFSVFLPEPTCFFNLAAPWLSGQARRTKMWWWIFRLGKWIFSVPPLTEQCLEAFYQGYVYGMTLSLFFLHPMDSSLERLLKQPCRRVIHFTSLIELAAGAASLGRLHQQPTPWDCQTLSFSLDSLAAGVIKKYSFWGAGQRSIGACGAIRVASWIRGL